MNEGLIKHAVERIRNSVIYNSTLILLELAEFGITANNRNSRVPCNQSSLNYKLMIFRFFPFICTIRPFFVPNFSILVNVKYPKDFTLRTYKAHPFDLRLLNLIERNCYSPCKEMNPKISNLRFSVNLS